MSIAYTPETVQLEDVDIVQVLKHLSAVQELNELLQSENTRHLETIAEQDETIELLQIDLSDRNQRIEQLELKIAYIEVDQDRHKRLSSSKHVSGNQKVILLAIEDEIKAKVADPQEFAHVDLMTIERKTGLAHSTICKEVHRLEEWGAFERDDTFVERQKKGRKIIVDKISLALTDLTMQSPEDISPGAGKTRNWGGGRLRCAKCKSENVRRLFHIQCLDCGHEYINRPSLEAKNDELFQVERVQAKNHDDQAHQHSRLETPKQIRSTSQLVQLERVRGNLAIQVETQNQTQPNELVQVERVHPQLAQLETHITTPDKSIKLEELASSVTNSFNLNEFVLKELRVCGRCGEIPTFVKTSSGNKVCSCSQYSLDELKKHQGPQQTELL